MNHQFRKRSGPTRVLLYILFIGVMLALSVTTAASAYTITATVGSHGKISPSGTVPVDPGGDILFFIDPDSGYHFDLMTIDGKVTPVSPVYKFSNVNADHSISVTFAPDQGSLKVSSDPNGATIFIDGTDAETTPKTVTNVPAGTHELRLALAGYNDYTSTVNVEKDQTTNVPKINLVPVTTTVPTTITTTTTPISVSSTPSGASVYLDGSIKGTTPLTIPSVSYGTHTLRLTYPGYQDSSNPVTVSESTHNYAYTLTPTPVGTTTPISVSSTPSGASVYLDGSIKGTTPLTIPSVSYGTHTLRLTYPGYQDSSNQVTVSESTHNYAYTLTPTPVGTTTPISVSSTPSGASVYLDGSNKGTTPLTIPSVSYGAHTLRLTYPRYQDSSNQVTVSESTHNYAYTLTPTPVGTTTPISVSSTPSGASVYLDGSNKGTTPLTIPSVSYGTHTLRLTYPGYQDSSNPVTVSETSYTYVYTLTPISVGTTTPISVGSTPSGASVYLDESNKGTTPLTIPSVSYGTHTLRLTYPGYQDSSNPVTVSEISYTYVYTLTPTGQISVVVPERTVVPNPTPTSNTTPVPTATPTQVINGTPLPVTPTENVTSISGINNSSVLVPVGPSPQDTRVNGTANSTGTGLQPPAGLASWNVIIFLFIAGIPLFLLLAHDYLGLGHLSFPQPLAVRAGVAFGQVACGIGLVFVLSRMIALLQALTDTLTLPLLLIVLLLGAYLIFSALALAAGSLMSSPLRWTLKVHVVVGVIILIVTPILLFSLGQGEVTAILVTIIAVPVSALLALWQDHSLALQVQKRGFPYGFFNGDETRVPSGSDPYRRSTATRPDIFPPELADRYTSIDFLGMGGISHVFRAMRLKDGMTVAVKIPIRFDETTGKCFMKEILAWEGLRHPNIVEITEVNILPIPYVEMEFVKSGLADLKTPLPVGDAAEIVTGVAEGLAYAHEQGIIHRDIKPQNILIDRNGVPKISDWGMSRLIGSSAIPTVAGFSLAYAAPEQISPGRFGETDARTDIYQLGVVFYELVTGKLLFPGDDLAEVSNGIISRMPLPPSDVNPLARPLDPIILLCLQKNPKDRYQSVRMLLLDLKRFLDSQHDTGDDESWYEGKGTVE